MAGTTRTLDMYTPQTIEDIVGCFFTPKLASENLSAPFKLGTTLALRHDFGAVCAAPGRGPPRGERRGSAVDSAYGGACGIILGAGLRARVEPLFIRKRSVSPRQRVGPPAAFRSTLLHRIPQHPAKHRKKVHAGSRAPTPTALTCPGVITGATSRWRRGVASWQFLCSLTSTTRIRITPSDRLSQVHLVGFAVWGSR